PNLRRGLSSSRASVSSSGQCPALLEVARRRARATRLLEAACNLDQSTAATSREDAAGSARLLEASPNLTQTSSSGSGGGTRGEVANADQTSRSSAWNEIAEKRGREALLLLKELEGQLLEGVVLLLL